MRCSVRSTPLLSVAIVAGATSVTRALRSRRDPLPGGGSLVRRPGAVSQGGVTQPVTSQAAARISTTQANRIRPASRPASNHIRLMSMEAPPRGRRVISWARPQSHERAPPLPRPGPEGPCRGGRRAGPRLGVRAWQRRQAASSVPQWQSGSAAVGTEWHGDRQGSDCHDDAAVATGRVLASCSGHVSASTPLGNDTRAVRVSRPAPAAADLDPRHLSDAGPGAGVPFPAG